MAIVRGATDLESIIVLTDEPGNVCLSSGAYQNVINDFRWLLKNADKEEMTIVRGAEKQLIKDFVSFFSSFFAKIGLPFERRQNSDGIYLRRMLDHQMYIEVYCEGVKIFPERDGRNFLDGFVPEIQIFLDPANPNQIRTTCQLRADGLSGDLSLLLELFPLCYVMEKTRPIICLKSSSGDIFDVAPLNEVGLLLKKLRSLAEFFGENKIRELLQIKDIWNINFESVRRNDLPAKTAGKAVSALKNVFARVLLADLGIEM